LTCLNFRSLQDCTLVYKVNGFWLKPDGIVDWLSLHSTKDPFVRFYARRFFGVYLDIIEAKKWILQGGSVGNIEKSPTV